MSRVISLRLDDDVDARLSGAAVLKGQTVSAYVKGLLNSDRAASDTGIATVLHRLDDLAASVEHIRGTMNPTQGQAPSDLLSDLPSRSLIASRLKARGLPTSTIRQVEAVLDELGATS